MSKEIEISKVLEYVCLRCGHQWMPRTRERSRACPKCKSPWWDRKRKYIMICKEMKA